MPLQWKGTDKTPNTLSLDIVDPFTFIHIQSSDEFDRCHFIQPMIMKEIEWDKVNHMCVVL